MVDFGMRGSEWRFGQVWLGIERGILIVYYVGLSLGDKMTYFLPLHT